jgi:3-oxoacyl-[acyl-carrier-protein] synthase I
MSDSVVVVGTGMMSAAGLTAAETCASVRAGTMRFVETDLYDKRFEPFTLATVPEEGLPPVTDLLDDVGLPGRERRLLRLATNPIRECLAPFTRSGSTASLALCLALPESETTKPLNRSRFLQSLALQVEGAIDPLRSDASHTGRAGGVVAIGQAVLTIQQGIAEFVVAGGIDSFRDLHVLGTLDAEARVKSAVNLDGFVPGEGAGFVLLASERAAAARGLTPLARVSSVAVGFESGHLYAEEAYRGDGLATTFTSLAASGALTPAAGEIYSSMNGESHWAKEWGVSYLRNRAAFLPVYRIHHPADSLGDTGAAAGPLMVGLAAHGIRGSYRRSPAVVYGSSDHGQRAALVVSTA